MDEFIRVQFARNGKPLLIKRRVPGGIEFEERDPIERTVGITFDGHTPATRERMNSIRRIQGWDPGQFKLKVSVEDGSLMLRGVNEHALPEGVYKLRLQIEEARTPGGSRTASVKHDGSAGVTVDVEVDDRSVAVDLDQCDDLCGEVLARSRIDGLDATEWLHDANRRPTRQACLLNLLASLRTRPTMTDSLMALTRNVFFVSNDRIYAKVDRSLLGKMKALALDPKKPFYEEGTPKAAIHGQLLECLPEPPDVKMRFTNLVSFRGEGSPSMQVVVAEPPPDLPHTYAEFDLDLGNPLQDVMGFFIHMGELLDGKPTNHLDLHKNLKKTKASPFLYYKVA